MPAFPQVFAVLMLALAVLMIGATIYVSRKVSPGIRATPAGYRALAIMWLISILFALRAVLSLIIVTASDLSPVLMQTLTALMTSTTVCLVITALISFLNSRSSLRSAYAPNSEKK